MTTKTSQLCMFVVRTVLSCDWRQIVHKPFSLTEKCLWMTYFFALWKRGLFDSLMAELEWHREHHVVQQDFITANPLSSSSAEVLPLSFHPLRALIQKDASIIYHHLLSNCPHLSSPSLKNPWWSCNAKIAFVAAKDAVAFEMKPFACGWGCARAWEEVALATRRSFGEGSHCTDTALIRLSQLMQRGWLWLRRPCCCTGITCPALLCCRGFKRTACWGEQWFLSGALGQPGSHPLTFSYGCALMSPHFCQSQ